ncbi:MFS transporter [Streptomyces sp. FH025]|uniref:MFS transporter n=1 Tax=Streptomyces sp. FH025 TaxID=2815937 RepID=UPI001A9FEA52|nr:MFS transporter [Streptomyces sp. FH025]MBO1418308.1 MFS transporter [Streptomyces sp. FH025]
MVDEAASDSKDASPEQGWRARTAILTLGAFAVGTDGYVIVGLLPQIDRTLHVSSAASGQLVSVFALVVAFLAPVLATVTSKWPRQRVLVTALLLLGVGNAVTALSGDYGLVLASRILAGAGAALFTANAVATAAFLAPGERRGSAIAMVTAGSTLSLILGAPLGTVIGNNLGWQAAIWFIAGIAVVVAVAVAALLPAIRIDQVITLRQRLSPLADRRVLKILAVTLLAFIGIFLPFTYMSAVFAPATGGSQPRLALLLMAFGVAATVGNLAAGRLADRYNARLVVIIATLCIGSVFLIMLAVRGTFVLAVVMEALAGLVCFSVIGPQQQRIIAHAPEGGAPLVTSLNLSTAYLGNFVSSVIGAVILSTASSAAFVLPVAAGFALAASLIAWWTARPVGAGGEDPAEGTTRVAAATK